MNLELLWEPEGLTAFDLPAGLAALYPGTLGFDAPCVFGNFVETADGVVAIPSIDQSNQLIAAGNPADRFVMGLLRACADAVVVGSGTLSGSPGGTWTAEQAYPDATKLFHELRRARGRPDEPEVAILSASGAVDPGHRVFEAGAILITTDAGRASIRDRLPAASTLVSVGDATVVDPAAALEALRARGHELVLHEGGPHAIGSFLEAGLVDELFLTLSPLLTGRTQHDPRFALVEGVDLLPGRSLRLLGVRREADHLFLRYAILPR